jgi:lipid A 3-O-deacylase
MKRVLFFFFSLLLFYSCDQAGSMPPVIKPGKSQPMTPASNHGKSSVIPDIADRTDISNESTIPDKKRKRRKAPYNSRNQFLPSTPPRSPDSLFISRLRYLRSKGIEPDLNEPVSKDYLLSAVDNGRFPSMITLSRESFLKVNFDNDILDYTDRFYTNGIKIEIISPGLQQNPVSRLTLPYWSSGTNYYGLSLVQNMFTPSTTKTGGILYGDRPYASYLYVGSFKITNDSAHKFRQTSEFDIGIIGPNSYGEWVQRSFHNSVPTNNEPLGWEYQIQNDLLVNYSISYEKGLVSQKYFEILLASVGNIGTLYTNLSGGAQLRAGWLNPYFSNLGVAKKPMLLRSGLRNVQFFLFIKGSGKLVGYDATLQGGLFNQSSTYTLPADQISRVVFQGSGGIAFSWNGIRLDLEQFMLSPEFQDGLWHKWVHLALTFSL